MSLIDATLYLWIFQILWESNPRLRSTGTSAATRQKECSCQILHFQGSSSLLTAPVYIWKLTDLQSIGSTSPHWLIPSSVSKSYLFLQSYLFFFGVLHFLLFLYQGRWVGVWSSSVLLRTASKNGNQRCSHATWRRGGKGAILSCWNLALPVSLTLIPSWKNKNPEQRPANLLLLFLQRQAIGNSN